jgi:hypothetical protein
MTKAISTQLSRQNIEQVKMLLAAIPPRLTAAAARLTEPGLRQPLGGAGERSVTECLAHLLNCEAQTTEAIYQSLLVDEPRLVTVHPEKDFGKLVRYAELDFQALLAYFTFRRTVLLRVLERLTEKLWSRAAVDEGKRRNETVYWRARALALHEDEHLTDLEAKLNRQRKKTVRET